jgi:hypothetical protein
VLQDPAQLVGNDTKHVEARYCDPVPRPPAGYNADTSNRWEPTPEQLRSWEKKKVGHKRLDPDELVALMKHVELIKEEAVILKLQHQVCHCGGHFTTTDPNPKTTLPPGATGAHSSPHSAGVNKYCHGGKNCKPLILIWMEKWQLAFMQKEHQHLWQLDGTGSVDAQGWPLFTIAGMNAGGEGKLRTCICS